MNADNDLCWLSLNRRVRTMIIVERIKQFQNEVANLI